MVRGPGNSSFVVASPPSECEEIRGFIVHISTRIDLDLNHPNMKLTKVGTVVRFNSVSLLIVALFKFAGIY